ncbi:class I SAM-dependent methyltransferase [Flindersiella endophytica]
MMSETEWVPPGVDPTRPSSGRLYDYYLGGTANLEVDRKAAEQIRMMVPELEDAAWSNRGFLQRSTQFLALECGITQFIDIGAGLPTRNNTHEAVQFRDFDAEAEGVDLRSHVVYVDKDLMVVLHAQALLQDVANTAFILGDLRDPRSILNHPDTRSLIDFSQPVGLIMAAVVNFVPDAEDPWSIVAEYMDALAPGSYLVLSHPTADGQNEEVIGRAVAVYEQATEQLYVRTKDEVGRFFDGLELVPPYDGAKRELTYVGLWGAEDVDAADSDGSRFVYCGVARKP